jgi:thiol-disulfide isomerase/thioredoxin
MKQGRSLMVPTFVLLCLLASCSEFPRPADDFHVKLTDGQWLWLSKLKGKVVVLNFWATWCPACQQQIPRFLEVYKKYSSQGLEILGLSIEQGEESEVISFIRSHKMSYPVAIADSALVSDYGPIDYIPTTFIVNKDGDIVDKHVGGLSSTQLESIIKPLLGLAVD